MLASGQFRRSAFKFDVCLIIGFDITFFNVERFLGFIYRSRMFTVIEGNHTLAKISQVIYVAAEVFLVIILRLLKK